MTPWWSITYFNRDTGYKKYDSSMIPFKLLPELDELSVKRGHKFKTDEFEITIPGTEILLHMPSRSLWIDGKPTHVKDAERIILFNRNYRHNNGTGWREVYIGLLNYCGRGVLIKYNLDNKKYTIKLIEGYVSESHVDMQDSFELPQFEAE